MVTRTVLVHLFAFADMLCPEYLHHTQVRKVDNKKPPVAAGGLVDSPHGPSLPDCILDVVRNLARIKILSLSTACIVETHESQSWTGPIADLAVY